MKPPTRAPFYAAMYHGLCATARQHGYALAIHGTVTSDLDLIACPWTEEAAPAEVLKDALMAHINACDYEGSLVRFGLSPEQAREIAAKTKADKEEKPHGRSAWNLYLDAGCKVDLSVMPRNVEQRGDVLFAALDAIAHSCGYMNVNEVIDCAQEAIAAARKPKPIEPT